MIEKAIFLDIDGVLNSEEYYIHRQKDWSGKFKFSYDLDEIAIQRLNKIIENTKINIVLSSTWRLFQINEVINSLKYKGFKYDIEYVTTFIPMDRGLQILKFIKNNNVKDYIVIDDDDFDIKAYIPTENFVHTSFKYGLTDKNVDYIINYFNKKV
jgi:hypothetical protein